MSHPPAHRLPVARLTTADNPWGALVAITSLLGLLALFVWVAGPHHIHSRLLVAPMMGGLGPCLYGDPVPAHLANDGVYRRCQEEGGSAAPVIAATLKSLTQDRPINPRYALGYTLNAPLLKFLKPQGSDWVVDIAAVNRLVKTIAQTPRQGVLYLFSTHFSAEAAIEPVLASDARNMAVHPKGVMGLDKYFGMDIYPWSIARTDNSITAGRLAVIDAIGKALCAQPAEVRTRLLGITLLGETHHHFPAFETGMGFGGPYEVSDYSEASFQGFRRFLAQRFGSLEAFNRALVTTGARYANFNEVFPPVKDLMAKQNSAELDARLPLWAHLDAYATGRFPVAGWLAPHPELTGRVMVLLDGHEVARVPAQLGRQDVLFHKPELGTADVGWRHDIDFTSLAPGAHQVTTLAETRRGLPRLMDQRTITVVAHRTAAPQPRAAVPPLVPMPRHQQTTPWLGNMDEPRPGAHYLYNPLAALWQDFRRQQVVDYLKHLARPLETACLSTVPRYVHQLLAFPNPSWDESKHAIERSLEPDSGFELGVSLYGEAGYGRSFSTGKRPTAVAATGSPNFTRCAPWTPPR